MNAALAIFTQPPYTLDQSRQNTIGNTPIVKIGPQLYAKLESINPSGSIKDRMASYILGQAEKKGEIRKGQTIVEATSGNTGIAFSKLAQERGYKMIVVMPSNMSEERKAMIRSYGAEIVEVGAGDFLGACVKRDELIQQLGAFNPNQFTNLNNRYGHKITTAQEILEQLKKAEPQAKIAAFVAGVGTGGTLMGVRDGLIEAFPEVQIVGVEPSESAAMSAGTSGEHLIQGIGDGFIPEIVKMDLIDEVITVTSQEAVDRTQQLKEELNLLVGISSGANVKAAEIYIEKYRPDGMVVTVLPDSHDRYFSLMEGR